MSYQTPYQVPPSPVDALDPYYQRRQDDDHLRLLAVFHYVYGGLIMAGGLVFLLYIAMGILMGAAAAGTSTHTSANDAAMGAMASGFMIVMGVVGIAVCLAVGGLKVWAGRCLQGRKGYTLTTIVACLDCLSIPLGTVLGVFTLVVLSRPSVRASFQGETPPPTVAAYEPQHGDDWYR